MSYKSVLQECPVRVTHKSVLQECPTRASYKSVIWTYVVFGSVCIRVRGFHLVFSRKVGDFHGTLDNSFLRAFDVMSVAIFAGLEGFDCCLNSFLRSQVAVA